MLSGILLVGLCVAVLVLAMAESALAFASRAKLEEVLDHFAARERYFRYLQRSGPGRTFCVAGRVVAVAAAVTMLAMGAGDRPGLLVAHVGAGAAVLALAELAGRLAGRKWSTHVLLVLLPPLQVAWSVALPLRLLCRRKASRVSAVPDEQVVDAAREEIRVAVEDAASEGAIHADEKDMIEGVLEFEDVEVHGIMTPRTEIECLEVNTPLARGIEMASTFHHSRIPVYEEVRDKVVGIVHLKDLLPAAARSEGSERSLREIMREPFFVPETKRAVSLLREFKQKHVQIAIILDEYGGVTGLATLENVVEQIVGELEEGFEAERINERVRVLGPGTLDVDARLNVSEVNDLLGVSLPEDGDYDTVGGFMMTRFASVPQKGRELRCSGLLFRVLDGGDRRVRRVLLQRLGPDESQEPQ